MAEAIARHEASDIIIPSSAGLVPLGYIAGPTSRTLLGNGFQVDDLFSKPVTRDLWNDAEIVINMSGRRAPAAFPDFRDLGKVENWLVQDPYGADTAVYQRIFEDIRQRIQELADRLRAI